MAPWMCEILCALTSWDENIRDIVHADGMNAIGSVIHDTRGDHHLTQHYNASCLQVLLTMDPVARDHFENTRFPFPEAWHMDIDCFRDAYEFYMGRRHHALYRAVRGIESRFWPGLWAFILENIPPGPLYNYLCMNPVQVWIGRNPPVEETESMAVVEVVVEEVPEELGVVVEEAEAMAVVEVVVEEVPEELGVDNSTETLFSSDEEDELSAMDASVH